MNERRISRVILLCSGKGSEIGDYLTTHPKVNCVSFTGGDTGISICKKGGMTPYQMELGGKDACIVCADADLDLAAKNIVKVGQARPVQSATSMQLSSSRSRLLIALF